MKEPGKKFPKGRRYTFSLAAPVRITENMHTKKDTLTQKQC
jgi:hypothetical protein